MANQQIQEVNGEQRPAGWNKVEEEDRINAVKLLIGSGADMHIRKRRGESALDLERKYSKKSGVCASSGKRGSQEEALMAQVTMRYIVYMKKLFPPLIVLAMWCATLNLASATPLHDAVKAGDLVKTQQLLDAGVDVNAKDEQSSTPLHWAVESGILEITQLLLEHHADIESVDNNGNTPLHVAAAKGRRKAVALLLEHGAKIDVLNNGRHTPLHLAIQEGRIATIEDLLGHGANTGVMDDEEGNGERGQDALSFAIAGGKDNIINLLLSKGVVVQRQHIFPAICAHDLKFIRKLVKPSLGGEPVPVGAAALAKTTMCGNMQILDFLMSSAGKIDYDGVASNLSEWITSTQSPNIDLVKILFAADKEIKKHASQMFYRAVPGATDLTFLIFLLGKGADINQKDEGERNPLHFAAQSGNLEIVKFLVEHGVQINATTGWGNTPMMLAIPYGQNEVVKYLLDHGANVNAANELGNTALHLAAARNMTEMSALLIKKGAKVNVKNNDGNTPLHQAVRFPAEFDTARLLLSNKAAIKARNANGFTALHCAATRGTYMPDEAGTSNQDGGGHPYEEIVEDKNLMELIQYLVKNKADTRAKDARGRYPIDLARENKAHPSIVSYLEAQIKGGKR